MQIVVVVRRKKTRDSLKVPSQCAGEFADLIGEASKEEERLQVNSKSSFYTEVKHTCPNDSGLLRHDKPFKRAEGHKSRQAQQETEKVTCKTKLIINIIKWFRSNARRKHVSSRGKTLRNVHYCSCFCIITERVN